MGFLDKLLGREKKPAQESAPTPAPMNEPPAHEHTHDDDDEPHTHDEPSHEGEQSPPA